MGAQIVEYQCVRARVRTPAHLLCYSSVSTRVSVFKLYFNALLVPPPPAPCALTLTSSSPSQEPQRLDEGEQRLFFNVPLPI